MSEQSLIRRYAPYKSSHSDQNKALQHFSLSLKCEVSYPRSDAIADKLTEQNGGFDICGQIDRTKRRYFRALCRTRLRPYSKLEQSRAYVLLYVARDSGCIPGFVNFINYLILKPCVFEPICVILILVYSLLIYNCCAPMRLHALACVHCDTFIYKPCVLNGR